MTIREQLQSAQVALEGDFVWIKLHNSVVQVMRDHGRPRGLVPPADEQIVVDDQHTAIKLSLTFARIITAQLPPGRTIAEFITAAVLPTAGGIH